jgi:uncharacterized protein (TIRG00374 family)
MYADKQSRPVEIKTGPEVQPADKLFNNKNLKRGVIWFVLLTVAAVASVFFYFNTGETLKAVAAIQPIYIAICAGMAFLDLMLGSWRNHIYVRQLNPRLSHWVSFRANVANMFMGAITPFHGGAGPAQLYVYHANGLPVLSGFVISLINMVATLLFMSVSGLAAVWIMKDHLDSGLVPVLLKYGFVIFTSFLAFFLVGFFRPVWIARAVSTIASRMGKVWPRQQTRFASWATKTHASILLYQKICKDLLYENPVLFPLSLLITGALYLNKYCMQYVILLGLGLHPQLTEVISIQILIQFMIYFAPSPGGSGFAEAGIAVLFSKIVRPAIMPLFTVLQRSFLLFLPAMVGAYVVLRLLKRQASK